MIVFPEQAADFPPHETAKEGFEAQKSAGPWTSRAVGGGGGEGGVLMFYMP